MSGRTLLQRTLRARRFPRLEVLECRALLSGLPGVALTEPTDSQILSQSPQQLVVTFSDFNPASFVNDNISSDFQLLKVNGDGTTTPSWNDFTQTPVVTAPTLTVTLQAVGANITLAPGTYELELVHGGLSADASGAYNNPPEQLWDPAANQVIGTFAVTPPPSPPPVVTRLGTIGSQVTTVQGTINPSNSSSAVAVYQFSLGAGTYWQLGVAVSTQNMDSSLQTVLTLMNNNGTVLESRASGTGVFSDPNDPYIFSGLNPGTYMVAVTAAPSSPGGAFALSLIAQPHTQATQVVGFSLNHADPNDPSPTSFSLSFSAPINAATLFNLDPALQGLEVVDSSGQEWPITDLEYATTSAQLTMVINEPLPAGQYSLILRSQNPLSDLAGVPVSAPGEPAGVLANWTVAARSSPKGPNDLGVLWTSGEGQFWPFQAGTIVETTRLIPDQPVTYRWVANVSGIYMFDTLSGGSDIEIVNTGNGKSTILDAGSSGDFNNYLMANLSAGIYELTFLKQGVSPALVRWDLRIWPTWDTVLVNGLNASSALSLMTFSPTSQGSDSGGSSGLMSVNPTPGGGPLAATFSGSPFGGSMSPLSPNLFVTVNTGLMGQPNGNNQALVSADASALGSAQAQAGGPTGESLFSGDSSLLTTSTVSDVDSQPVIDNPGQAAVAQISAVATQLTNNISYAKSDDSSSQADASAVAQADLLGDMGSLIQTWLAPSQPNARQEGIATASVPAHSIAAGEGSAGSSDPDGTSRNRRFLSTLRGDFGAAASLITVGAIAYGMNRPIRKWWRQYGQLGAPTLSPASRRLPYPYSPHRISRVATHVRKPLQTR
jgi:hypothetical protein